MTIVKPMLAHSKTPDLSTLTYPQIVQPKFDGIRALVVDGVLVSRSAKPIRNAEIQAALGRPEFNGLDGELLVGDPTANDAMQRTSEVVMKEDRPGREWRFYVFDLHDTTAAYTVRFADLAALLPRFNLALSAAIGRSDGMVLVAGTEAADPAEVGAVEAAFVAEGYEGAILRDPRAAYKHGRSGKTGPLLKVKRFIDFEARVVGCYERMHNANDAKRDAFGRTERSTAKDGLIPAGDLGGFELVALNGPHEGQTFRCGTGFDAAQRDEFWKCHTWPGGTFPAPEPLVGRIAKIKSFPVGVKDAPRFPTFLGFRDADDMGVES
jgi:DNA ligase-1